jgi:hypothetical protein
MQATFTLYRRSLAVFDANSVVTANRARTAQHHRMAFYGNERNAYPLWGYTWG